MINGQTVASKGIWADFGAGGTGCLPNTIHPIMNCFQSRKKRKYFQAAVRFKTVVSQAVQRRTDLVRVTCLSIWNAI